MKLSKRSFSMLKYVYRHPHLTYGQLKKRFAKAACTDMVNNLRRIGLISVSFHHSGGGHMPYRRWISDDCSVLCTESGMAYYEEHCFRHWVFHNYFAGALIGATSALTAELVLFLLSEPFRKFAVSIILRL